MIRDVTGMYPVSKQELTGSPSGPVKTYYLSPEELAYYRNLPRPQKVTNIVTVAQVPKSRGAR